MKIVQMLWLILLFTGFLFLATGESFQYALPNYEHHRLANGFEIILVENHTNPLVASVVVIRTGLRNETPENNGVSHMLEHLSFNGTQRRTQKELYDELDYYGIYLNAQTSEDYTSYMALHHKDYLNQALDIMSDMLFQSTFPEEKFEKEKGIIVEEIRKDSEDPDKDFGPIDPAKTVHFAFGSPLHVAGRGTGEHHAIIAFITAKLREWGADVRAGTGTGGSSD